MVAAFAALLCLAGLVSGCGSSGSSSSGIETKSPQEIVSSAQTAIEGVSSVHVAGSVTSSGTPITLDLHLVSNKGAKGQMSEGGLGFQIVAVNRTVYINGSEAFWRHFGGSAAAQLFNGKWLKAPESGQFGTLAQLTNLQSLLGQALSHHGTLARGQTTTIRGQKVVAVHDTTEGGTLYVATTGKPYPIEISKSGNSGGHLSFDRFNEAVDLTPPANAIDISRLTSG